MKAKSLSGLIPTGSLSFLHGPVSCDAGSMSPAESLVGQVQRSRADVALLCHSRALAGEAGALEWHPAKPSFTPGSGPHRKRPNN
ncbi:hypothetical protein [Roseateles aquatilis]|uniref:hypothetical protein n=1 Tax=Roseateles aquatilis TaxID=431061 RepID=UPI00113190EA|nr:hypothetical protein [Roseateles aquatilis]